MIDPMHFDRIEHDDVVEKWYVHVSVFMLVEVTSFLTLMQPITSGASHQTCWEMF